MNTHHANIGRDCNKWAICSSEKRVNVRFFVSITTFIIHNVRLKMSISLSTILSQFYFQSMKMHFRNTINSYIKNKIFRCQGCLRHKQFSLKCPHQIGNTLHSTSTISLHNIPHIQIPVSSTLGVWLFTHLINIILSVESSRYYASTSFAWYSLFYSVVTRELTTTNK